MSARSRRLRRRASHKRNPLLLTLVVLGSGIALAVMSFGMYVISVAADAPDIDTLQPVQAGENSIVYAADGSRLGYIQSDEARTTVKMNRIPQDLQDATVAIEDERFYEHDGVDLEGIIRAASENIEAGEVKQGGSTITMQLVRNLYIEDPDRDIERKIKEAKLAEEPRGRALQARDPRAVPELRLLRHRQRPHRRRRRGRRADLLLEAREGPDACRSRR